MYNYRTEIKRGFYTDLACERRRASGESSGIEYKKRSALIGTWERVRVKDECGAEEIERPVGTYDTLTLPRLDTLDDELIYDAREEVAKALCTICTENGIFPARILVAGFGNRELTPDSVGPKSATRVKPTLHISRYDSHSFEMLECSEIATVCPDVSAHSGLSSADTVAAICKMLTPDLLIAIDSISTLSTERLGRSIQISNTGIFPGGIGNLSAPITKERMGLPVIGIGVPTVIDARLLGSIGEGGTRFCEPYLVAPREADEITDNAAVIIGDAINQAFGLCPP